MGVRFELTIKNVPYDNEYSSSLPHSNFTDSPKTWKKAVALGPLPMRLEGVQV